MKTMKKAADEFMWTFANENLVNSLKVMSSRLKSDLLRVPYSQAWS